MTASPHNFASYRMQYIVTLVLRTLQAAHARDTRARFDCVGGASLLGEVVGSRGRRVRDSPGLTGSDCREVITHIGSCA